MGLDVLATSADNERASCLSMPNTLTHYSLTVTYIILRLVSPRFLGWVYRQRNNFSASAKQTISQAPKTATSETTPNKFVP